MKEKLSGPALWQKKRNELPVEGDASLDWLQMASALDTHMPLTGKVAKPYTLKGSKWLYKLLIGLSSAVIIYGVIHYYLTKPQPLIEVPQQSSPVVKPPVHRDSSATDSASNVNNSAPAAAAATIKGKPIVQTRPASSPASATVIHTGKDSSLMPDNKRRDTIGIIDAAPLSSGSKFINDNHTIHRDSSMLPANLNLPKPIGDPANIGGKKNTADSLKKVKKKKRRIGVFT